LGSGWDTR